MDVAPNVSSLIGTSGGQFATTRADGSGECFVNGAQPVRAMAAITIDRLLMDFLFQRLPDGDVLDLAPGDSFGGGLHGGFSRGGGGAFFAGDGCFCNRLAVRP